MKAGAITTPAEESEQKMKTDLQNNDCNEPPRYVLRRELGYWNLTFEGREAIFKHERGALYVASLLLDPPREPIHAVALALKARNIAGYAPGTAEIVQERNLGLDDAAAIRALWRRQRELEAVMDDPQQIEPVKAEALREFEEVSDYLRKSPWRGRHSAGRCVRAVSAAIKRLHARLAQATDAEARPHPVLQAFARHLHEYLLVPSGRGGGLAWARAFGSVSGCFVYQPPRGIIWKNIAACYHGNTFCGPIRGE